MLNKSQSSEIFMLQKQCVRLLGKGKNIPIEELFKSCKVIKFPDMVQMELGKFGAKVVRKIIPEPLRMVMEARGGKKNHKYDNRYKNVPNIQKHATVQYNSSILCRSVAEYAKLPVELTSIHKTSLFAKN